MPLKTNIRQLPEGWVEKRLGDVCEKVEYGSSAKSKPEGKIPVLRMGNIQNGAIDWKDLAYTTDQEEIDRYSLKYNDVLFNRTNSDEHVGKTAIYKGERPAIFAGYLIRIHRKENLIDADFLNYYLNSNTTREYGKSVMSRSVNQANINGTKLKDYPILVPPLSEQKRIVEIVDQAFEGIDVAIAHTKKNLSNARELFESYLNAIFIQSREEWKEVELGVLSERITKGSSPKWQGINYVGEPGILFVTSENVGRNQMLFEKKKYVEEAFNEKDSKSILSFGDVLTNIVGASIGRTAIYDSDELANINQAVCLIRCKPEKLINKYLSCLLNSPYFRRILHDNEINNARANLSLSFFRSLKIPLPSLKEQQFVVSKMDDFSVETRRLEAIYQRKLAALAELKQSILQKAFIGELTADTTSQAAKKAEETIAA